MVYKQSEKLGMDKSMAKPYIDRLREQCLLKGVSGIKALSVAFRKMDTDFSKRLNLHEFRQGLKGFRVDMTDEDIEKLFDYLDKDDNGNIDFAEFLRELRPPMSQARIDVTMEAFKKLDTSGDGILEVHDLKGK